MLSQCGHTVIKQTGERQREKEKKDAREKAEKVEKEKRRNRGNKGRKLVTTVEEREKGFTVKTQLMKNCRNCKCLF